MAFILASLVACASAVARPASAPVAVKPVVAVAPFQSSSAEEHQWLSLGLVEMVLARLSRCPELLPMSVRQWGAVLRERDLPLARVDGDAGAVAVARSLGATLVVRGFYSARWPDLAVGVRVLEVGTGRLVSEASKVVKLERALELEDDLVRPVLEATGAARPHQGLLTRSVYAWHEATVCRELVTWQSLQPRARPLFPRAAAQDAGEHCQRAIALEPGYPDAWEGLGLAQALAGDTKAALASLQKARALRGWPDLAELGIFWVKFRSGSREEALRELAEVVAKRPGYLHARGTLGLGLLEARRFVDAKAQFEAYLALAPGQPWGLAQLGYVSARLGMHDEAMALSQQAVDRVPGDPVFHMELASRQVDAGRLAEAEATLRRVLELDSRLAVAYLRLGYVYLLRDDRMLARPILEKAIVEADLESEWRVRGLAHMDVAKLEMRQGKRGAALERLGKALAAGFMEVERMETDADLGALRGDAAFKALVEQARANRMRFMPAEGEGKAGP